MSQEYDVFAELYDDKDDKAKFLETLKSREKDLLANDSSDEDDLLPPSMRDRTRGKKGKQPPEPPKKYEILTSQDSNAKKTTKLPTTIAENVQQPLASAELTSLDVPATTSRRRSTRNSASTLTQTATNTTITATTSSASSARGRRGRRGRNNNTTNESSIGIDAGMSLTETLDIFRAMMGGGRGRRGVMRARRAYFAEMAARATNVGYVDLVSSPMPQISGVVTVDSDAEDSRSSNSVELTSTEKPPTSFGDALECSFDEDNPEISVKIKWDGGNPEIFKLRKYQKFHKIFDEIAKRENTPIDNLVFNIDNRIISASDTPASINYKIYEFISGRVLTDLFQFGTERKKRDANIISLKIQSDLWPKKPLKVELNKTDKLKILYIKCAEELKMPTEDLILSFNGDHLGFNDTPEDYELEGDEAVDLRIKKK